MFLKQDYHEIKKYLFKELKERDYKWRVDVTNTKASANHNQAFCWKHFVNSSPPSAAYMRQWTRSAISIGSGNGLASNRRQAITWYNADLLSIGPLGTNLSENRIEILTFSRVTLYTAGQLAHSPAT